MKNPDGLVFDADFDNGCLGAVNRMGANWYHLELRYDTWFFFHFQVRGCRGRELVFEYAAGKAVSRSGFTPGLPPPAGWAPEKPFCSYDGRQWSRVDHAEVNPQYWQRRLFRHAFREDEARICFDHPYTHRDMLEWLEGISTHPAVRTGTVGRSRNGVSQPLITVTENDSAREMVVLLGREDADETLGSWGIEGVVRRLLSDDFAQLRRKFVFQVVPMVCVDGVLAGATHSAGYGYGGFRWHENPAPAEIENVKKAVREWVGQGYRVKLAGKLHGGNRLLCGPPAGRPAQDIKAGSRETLEMLRRHRDEYWRAETGKSGGLEIRPPGYFERFINDEFGCPDVFCTHVQGETPEGARLCGEGLASNIGAWLAGAG